MPTVVPNSELLKIAYQPDKLEARQILSNLKAQLRTPKGQLKSGILALVNYRPGSEGEMRFERKGIWQMCATKSRRMNTTASYLKALFTQAYGLHQEDTAENLKFQSLMDQFQVYLDQRKNKIKTDKLEFFLDLFEKESRSQVLAIQSRTRSGEYWQWRVFPSEEWESSRKSLHKSSSGLAARENPRDDHARENAAQFSSRLVSGIVSQNSERDPQVKAIGHTELEDTYSFLDAEGRERILKLYKQEIQCATGPSAAMRGLEVCAARLKDEPHIIRPTAYLIETVVPSDLTRKYIFKVPSNHLKSFLRSMPAGSATVIGQITPLAPGKELEESGNGTSPRATIQDIAKPCIEALASLAGRKFIHHDIRPGNIIYDPKSKTVNLVDTGFLQKLSKNERKPTSSRLRAGNATTIHPRILREMPHGCEVDLFSLAFTLLSMRFPRGVDALTRERVDLWRENGNICYGAHETHKKWEVPGGEYLKKMVQSALKREADTSPAKDELRRIRDALQRPESQEGLFLNFIARAIDISFGKQEDYAGELNSLLSHRFLVEKAPREQSSQRFSTQ